MRMCLAMPSFAENDALPGDIRAFIKRRDNCDHFRGETASVEDRQAEIDRQLDRLCRGSDADVAHLKRKYIGKKTVLKILGTYDPVIEGGDVNE